MRHLLTCLAMLAAFNVTAQVDGFQMPYNPDSEPDGYIGVADVLEVLSIFGSQWNASDIYLSNDNSSMTMYVGELNYPACLAACDDLPSNWRLADLLDFGKISASLEIPSYCWMMRQESLGYGLNVSFQVGQFNINTVGEVVIGQAAISAVRKCYCSTHERPKVEYSICVGYGSGAWIEVEECGQLKVADGWYPLGSNDGASQAFWRWAD